MEGEITADFVFDWLHKSINQFGTDTSPEMRQTLIMSLIKTLPKEMVSDFFPKLQTILNDQPISTFTGHRFFFADPECSDSDLAYINDAIEKAVREDRIEVTLRILRKEEYIVAIGNQSARLHQELRDYYHYTKSAKTISRMSLEPMKVITA